MDHFKATTIPLAVIGIMFLSCCKNIGNDTNVNPNHGTERQKERVQPLKVDTYYLDIDSSTVNNLRFDYNEGTETYYLPHKGEYKVIGIPIDTELREAFSKLLMKLILESTDEQSACRILKEYYLNSKLRLPGHVLSITKTDTFIRMRHRVDSIFGVKLLRYIDSINERWVLTPYICSSIANPKYILPKYNKEALDEYCKLPCDSLIRLLKEAVNTPSDYYYIPPIKE